MSWADKQLKKHKLRKQIKEIMGSPEFQKERQKELDKHTAEAMNCFLLIICTGTIIAKEREF